MYMRLDDDAVRMVSERKRSPLERRQDRDGGGSVNYVATIIVAVVVIVLLVAASITWTYLRRKRAAGETPRIIPGFLHKRWHAWKPRQKYKSVGSGDRSSLNANTSYQTEERAANQAAAAGVDRHTSVRSVMTLPAYSQNPNESEQVLGREGERDGMDTVVEHPETFEEEESRREDQMESLYQIRLQRRREIAEREERRRERREARERGDFARLEELRRESRMRANNQSETSLNGANAANGGLSVSAATMIAEHQSRGRDRRISSVAYADIGTARADGTRIRANSNESERGGLLDNAAPMGDDASSLRPSTGRPSHHRERSGSSALSISTTGSDIEPAPTTGQSTSATLPRNSDSTDSSSPTATRFTPDESTEGEDIADSRIPPPTITTSDPSSPHPPDYSPPEEWGDAPAYTERQQSLRQSRTQPGAVGRTGSQRAFDEMASMNRTPTSGSLPPQLPQLELPSISVEAATADNSPLSPRLNEPERGRSTSRNRRSRNDNEEFMS